jgi:hypothetical protein
VRQSRPTQTTREQESATPRAIPKMRFIKDGPDLPESLVQAQEDGNIVFFCGAGVSYPAGLPSFQGLVKALYTELGEALSPVEQTAFRENRFDSVVYLLERRIGNRIVVREKLWKVLSTIDLTEPNSTETHRALLTLSKARDGQTRLVTTNFDRLFNAASPALPAYAAPLLPVPKRTRWDGIVYLHGLLPEDVDPAALNSLIVSSGDFGLAYLTERWASRFVAEIFREYTVCFVGYSLNDPVLRYMVDALSADQLLGEHTQEVYAFASFKKGKRDSAETEWAGKGVTPILYAETKDHRHLHATLRTWAADYRDGITGKQAIIRRYGPTLPSEVQGVDQVSRVLWALADRSGLPAKAFADLNPPAPIEWLKTLTEDLYSDRDLARFGVSRDASESLKAKFSVLQRPTSYHRSRWTALVGRPLFIYAAPDLDRVAWELAQWLASHHLDKQELLDWVIDRGGCMHPRFALFVRAQLSKGTLSKPLAKIWRVLSRKGP